MCRPKWDGRLVTDGTEGMAAIKPAAILVSASNAFLRTAMPMSWPVCACAMLDARLAIPETFMVACPLFLLFLSAAFPVSLTASGTKL